MAVDLPSPGCTVSTPSSVISQGHVPQVPDSTTVAARAGVAANKKPAAIRSASITDMKREARLQCCLPRYPSHKRFNMSQSPSVVMPICQALRPTTRWRKYFIRLYLFYQVFISIGTLLAPQTSPGIFAGRKRKTGNHSLPLGPTCQRDCPLGTKWQTKSTAYLLLATCAQRGSARTFPD